LKFNVLTDPWIPVVFIDGHIEDIGLHDCLIRANEIITLSNDRPYEKIAILRLLVAFAADAYQLENSKARERLFNTGCFSSSVIEDYEENCVNNCDASFDLFDEKRPFMVFPYDKVIDVEETRLSATYIHLEMPSGNNIIHINSQTEQDFEGDTPAEFLRSLLAFYLYPTGNMMKGANEKTGALCYRIKQNEDGSIKYGKQYGSMGINAGPQMAAAQPVFFWPEGDSLFHTIVMCMKSKKELGNLNLNHPCAPWNTEKVPKSNLTKRGDPVSSVSFVSGLTFQSRRVVPIVQDGLIKECYINNGYVNPDDRLWYDPFAVRIYNKKKEKFFYLQGDTSKAMWRNVGNLTSTAHHDWHLMPDVLKPIKKFEDIHHYQCIYSLAMIPKTQNAGYSGMLFDDTLELPVEFMDENYAELAEYLTTKMEMIEGLSSCWNPIKISGLVDKNNKGNGKYYDTALEMYWSGVHQFLLGGQESFLNRIIDMYIKDFITFSTSADEELNHFLQCLIYEICDHLEANTNSWDMLVKVHKKLYGTNGCVHKFNSKMKTSKKRKESK
jgi:hypothetical protein